MGLTDKQAEAFDKIKAKSDDDYEKNVVYIAAGTLVLSMTFLEKIIKLQGSTFIWVLIIGWGFLAFTLLCNLVSHQLSSLFHEQCRDLYDLCNEPEENTETELIEAYEIALKKANDKFETSNKIIRCLNWGTTLSLLIGIILLVIFCSANALKAARTTNTNDNNNLKDKTMSKQIKPQTQSTDISKGRTISAAVKPSTTTGNTASSGNQSTNSGSTNSQSNSK